MRGTGVARRPCLAAKRAQSPYGCDGHITTERVCAVGLTCLMYIVARSVSASQTRPAHANGPHAELRDKRIINSPVKG